MRYEGTVYRPPSEAYSLILQTTIGCGHNQCTFCSMYKEKKFHIRSLKEILKDLEEARIQYKRVNRIFLADGNALAMKTSDLKEILIKIQELFTECNRVGVYGAPKDILRKSKEELAELKRLGLGIIYLGVESGSDQILVNIKKGVTVEEMIEAGKKVVEATIKLSVTLISGLGGKQEWQEHAKASAEVINKIQPDYLGLLTLMLQPGTQMHDEVKQGKLELLTPKEVMMETQLLIENLELRHCVFRSNHASNYVALEGTFPQDKGYLLEQIKEIIIEKDDYKQEMLRRL